MGKAPAATLLLVLMVLAPAAVPCSAVRESDRESLVGFLRALAGGNEGTVRALGWDASVDPCGAGGGTPWRGVTCDEYEAVSKINLAGLRGVLDLNGTVEPALLCVVGARGRRRRFVREVDLGGNSLRGELPESISACRVLSRLVLGDNRLSGSLPRSLAQLQYLRELDVSRNHFTGEIPPGLAHTPLSRFKANGNRLIGFIPDFQLRQFRRFDVSSNKLTGPVPRGAGRFGAGSFLPNGAGLCGRPVLAGCPLSTRARAVLRRWEFKMTRAMRPILKSLANARRAVRG